MPTGLNPQQQDTPWTRAGLTGNSPHRANFAAGYRLPVRGQACRTSLVTWNAMPPTGAALGFTKVLEQTERTGALGSPAPAVNLELGVDMPDVNFNRIDRQVQLIADFS